MLDMYGDKARCERDHVRSYVLVGLLLDRIVRSVGWVVFLFKGNRAMRWGLVVPRCCALHLQICLMVRYKM